MLKKIEKILVNNLKNIPGWHSNRKLLTIECDDWGSIRMPSSRVFQDLSRAGLNIDTGWFNRFDTMETKDDLEYLFDTLFSVKDSNNNPAVMTAFCNVANPSFNEIKESDFARYYFEPFTETLKKYYPNDNVFNLYKEGIRQGIFVPELHGREHLTVQVWMDILRSGNKDLLLAFDHGFTSLEIDVIPEPAKEFRAEFFFTSEDQKPFLKTSIREATFIFKQIFGYNPKVFVPSNNIFHPDFDEDLSSAGIQFLCVSNRMPYPHKGKLKYRYFITGQRGPGILRYYTRNCAFEPSDYNYKGIGSTIQQIEAAFRWGKPASVSTHRVNFAGGIDPENRSKGISEFRKLLIEIIKRWPDVEFASSGSALEYLKSVN